MSDIGARYPKKVSSEKYCVRPLTQQRYATNSEGFRTGATQGRSETPANSYGSSESTCEIPHAILLMPSY